MKNLVFLLLLMTTTVMAQPLTWSVTLANEGQAKVIHSSGDVMSEEWPAPSQREVTGFVNQEQLQVLETLLADPGLDDLTPLPPGKASRVLSYTYGDKKKTFGVNNGSRFPEKVERICSEVERALRSVKD